jgi:hypothetical protein
MTHSIGDIQHKGLVYDTRSKDDSQHEGPVYGTQHKGPV